MLRWRSGPSSSRAQIGLLLGFNLNLLLSKFQVKVIVRDNVIFHILFYVWEETKCTREVKKTSGLVTWRQGGCFKGNMGMG